MASGAAEATTIGAAFCPACPCACPASTAGRPGGNPLGLCLERAGSNGSCRCGCDDGSKVTRLSARDHIGDHERRLDLLFGCGGDAHTGRCLIRRSGRNGSLGDAAANRCGRTRGIPGILALVLVTPEEARDQARSPACARREGRTTGHAAFRKFPGRTATAPDEVEARATTVGRERLEPDLCRASASA